MAGVRFRRRIIGFFLPDKGNERRGSAKEMRRFFLCGGNATPFPQINHFACIERGDSIACAQKRNRAVRIVTSNSNSAASPDVAILLGCATMMPHPEEKVKSFFNFIFEDVTNHV